MKYNVTQTFLSIISFSKLDKWYVSYYLNPFIVKSKFKLEKLSLILSPIKNKISKKDYDGSVSVVSKISFKDGKIHLRDENKTGMDLYTLDKKQLLVSKINFHQGAVAVNNIDKLVCSTHYQPYSFDTNRIIEEYLILALRSAPFLNFIKYLRADGIKNEATYDFIGELEIPLPTIEEQNRIIEAYNNKIQLAKKQEEKAKELEKGIEQYLFKELGVEKIVVKPFKKGIINLFSYKNTIDRWDVHKGSVQAFSSLYNSKFPVQTLSDCFTFTNRSWNKKKHEKKTFNYIELGAVDPIYGVTEIKEIELDKAPSRATQFVKEGDLIIGTTRPYLKRFAIIKSQNDYDIASSGFQIIEPSNDYNLEFLLEYLKSDFGVKQFEFYMTGALYPAITGKDLRKILIPFPPIEIQNKIAKKTNEMKSKIKGLKKRAQLNREQAIKEFENEIFVS